LIIMIILIITFWVIWTRIFMIGNPLVIV
jgi:hypothetical protein